MKDRQDHEGDIRQDTGHYSRNIAKLVIIDKFSISQKWYMLDANMKLLDILIHFHALLNIILQGSLI